MITLSIILGGLIVVTWGYAMFVYWQVSQGTPLALVESKPFVARWQQSLRLTRRGWYSTSVYSKQVLLWTNQKISALFVRLFPTSAPVFVKRDMLTGLTHGPSSFFLKTISSQKVVSPRRRLPRAKKMI
jgi:hypothetical protein